MNRWSVVSICLIIFSFSANAAARSIPVDEAEQPAAQEATESDNGEVSMTFLDSLNRGREIAVSIDTAEEAETVSPPAETQKQSSDDSFRIQIAASTQIESLHGEKEKLRSSTSLPVAILYDNPFYKLFAGTFQTRSDAESELPQIKELGYEDAWIVNTESLPD